MSFWQNLLEKTLHSVVQKLLAADWTIIMAEVKVLMNATEMTNSQKREYAVDVIRRLGYQGGTWLLRIGIEVAYRMIVTGRHENSGH